MEMVWYFGAEYTQFFKKSYSDIIISCHDEISSCDEIVSRGDKIKSGRDETVQLSRQREYDILNPVLQMKLPESVHDLIDGIKFDGISLCPYPNFETPFAFVSHMMRQLCCYGMRKYLKRSDDFKSQGITPKFPNNFDNVGMHNFGMLSSLTQSIVTLIICSAGTIFGNW